MENEIDIICIDKAELLAGLYNKAQPQGRGFMRADADQMTREQAQEILTTNNDFDYLKGRVMKVNLSSDTKLDARLYDRDNGGGTAQSVVDVIRAKNTDTQRADGNKWSDSLGERNGRKKE